MDFGVTAEGAPFLVMDLLDGRSLDAEIAKTAPIPTLRASGSRLGAPSTIE